MHKATIAVAVAESRRGGEVRHISVFPNRPEQIVKLVERLGKDGLQSSFCYEAGPCGYGLHRKLIELGHECIVVAPSLIEMNEGDRVRTDRRDGSAGARQGAPASTGISTAPSPHLSGQEGLDRCLPAMARPCPVRVPRPAGRAAGLHPRR